MEIEKKITELLSKVLADKQPLPFGFAQYSKCLPLLDCRAAQRIPQGAKSVITCLFPYYIKQKNPRNISRYAMIADYHSVAGKYLSDACKVLEAVFPEYQFVHFTDNSPIREVATAALSGLGIVGKHGLLISKDYGSYVFIGEIVTDLPMKISVKESNHHSCIDCGKCLQACPGKALESTGRIELSRCRSHITQKKGCLTQEETAAIKAGGLVWGCDICNDVCPMNLKAKETPIKEFLESVIPIVTTENIDNIIAGRAFNYRGKKVIQRNLELI